MACFEETRQKLNEKLAFSGFEYTSDGEFGSRPVARTLADAKRHETLLAKLDGGNVHPGVLAYCRPELLQNDYFHAVLEASKGLARRVRDESGSGEDGAKLVDEVFPKENPILAFNALNTRTEKSEHEGFAALLKGCFMAVRNPHAHTPKIHWEGEDNAADYFTLISMPCRKMDSCHRTA